MKDFRRYPQPKREMTEEDHKRHIDEIRQDRDLGDTVLTLLLVAVYKTHDHQNN